MTVSRAESISVAADPGVSTSPPIDDDGATNALNTLAGYERYDRGDHQALARAIADFQASAGLAETGRLDAATADALSREAARVASSREARESLGLPVTTSSASLHPASMHPLLACNLWEQVEKRAEAAISEGRDFVSDAIAEGERRAGVGLDDVGRGDMPSEASASRTFSDERAASRAFAHQVTRLFDVGGWDSLSGVENASFALFDADGEPVERTVAREGDFVRIDLPGPSGYDWVRIEGATLDAERASITVRPSHDPTADPVDESVTAHFFTREATNEFSVERDGATVTARVRGRDEHANTGEEAGDRVSALRNRAVAEGAWGPQVELPNGERVNGAQQHQWDRFTENLAALD